MTGNSAQWNRVAGARIKHLRKARGWTQRQLAAASGVAQSQVSEAENAESRAHPGTYASLAAALGLTVAELRAECGHCHGKPPRGYLCLSCGATAVPERAGARGGSS